MPLRPYVYRVPHRGGGLYGGCFLNGSVARMHSMHRCTHGLGVRSFERFADKASTRLCIKFALQVLCERSTDTSLVMRRASYPERSTCCRAKSSSVTYPHMYTIYGGASTDRR